MTALKYHNNSQFIKYFSALFSTIPFLLLISGILFSSCKHEDNVQAVEKLVNSVDFAQKFPLKDVKNFDRDSLNKIVANPKNALDTNLIKRLLPDSINKDGSIDSIYFCSVQKTKNGFLSYTYLTQGDLGGDIWRVNYDKNMKIIGLYSISGVWGDAGEVSSWASRCLIENTLVQTRIYNNAMENSDDSDKIAWTDSTVETVIINSNGHFNTLSGQNFHKEEKIKNENYKPQPDSSSIKK